MNYDNIILEKKGVIAMLTLNRPEKLNAINEKMLGDLENAVVKISRDRDIRVLIITGAGRAFCSGADVGDMAKSATGSIMQIRHWTQAAHKIILTITELEKPVIAKVNGLAVGIGCSLALSSDVIFASEEAEFSLIFSRIGLIPDGGALFHLPRLVGLAKAKELILTARRVNAKEAERIGLIYKAVPANDLGNHVTAFTTELANGPTLAYGLAKKIMNKGLSMDLSSVLEWEASGQALAGTTEDAREGIMAFLEKRKPRFKGI
ncbi:MAG: enoyl-CoA hydratase [Candidatus Bathyarchaeota archaeon]|nr:MAG: enoyl-CoA hydratase [Candidatus Bathyarchaeota archaeon]